MDPNWTDARGSPRPNRGPRFPLGPRRRHRVSAASAAVAAGHRTSRADADPASASPSVSTPHRRAAVVAAVAVVALVAGIALAGEGVFVTAGALAQPGSIADGGRVARALRRADRDGPATIVPDTGADETPTAAPTAPPLPALLGAIGDSYSQAYSVSPDYLYDHPQFSWVIGTAKSDGVIQPARAVPGAGRLARSSSTPPRRARR